MSIDIWKPLFTERGGRITDLRTGRKFGTLKATETFQGVDRNDLRWDEADGECQNEGYHFNLTNTPPAGVEPMPPVQPEETGAISQENIALRKQVQEQAELIDHLERERNQLRYENSVLCKMDRRAAK